MTNYFVEDSNESEQRRILMNRVLCCGDRNWKDIEAIELMLKNRHIVHSIEVLIEGEANGADILSAEVAKRLGIPILSFPANWKKYGKAAGVIRNQQMLDEGKPNLVLAFHDNIKESKGTKDMIHRAVKANIPVSLVYHYGQNAVGEILVDKENIKEVLGT